MVVEQYPDIDHAWEKKFFGKPRFSLAKLRAASQAAAEEKYGDKPMSVEAAKNLLTTLRKDKKNLTATHQKVFLDAFLGTKPTTTVAKWQDGETTLKSLKGEELEYWLKEYSLGTLFKSGELEQMG